MASVNRTTIWSVGQVLKSADLNNEFNNLLNSLNIVDADISASANIAVSKLNTGLVGGLVGTTDTQVLTNKTLTSPVINVGSDAQGDVYYRSAAGLFTRLAPGSSGQFLQTQGASANPLWASVAGGTDGWISIADTLVYASASTFTIAGVDRTATYTKGTRIKFTNNATTFFGVVASSAFSTNTTVTLIANNDYAIVNSAITNPFYSYSLNPQGYPGYFNFTPTLGAGGSMTFTATAVTRFIFSVNGRTCHIRINVSGTTGGSANPNLTFTLPVAISATDANLEPGGAIVVFDTATIAGIVISGANSSTFAVRRYDSANWGLGSGRAVAGTIVYEI